MRKGDILSCVCQHKEKKNKRFKVCGGCTAACYCNKECKKS